MAASIKQQPWHRYNACNLPLQDRLFGCVKLSRHQQYLYMEGQLLSAVLAFDMPTMKLQ